VAVKMLIKISLIIFLLIGTAISNNFHGAALQMTSDGTGVYYKPGINLKQHSNLMGVLGIHLNNKFQNVSRFEVGNRNRSIYLDLSAEFKQELLQEMIAGAFRPVITIQGGSIADVSSITGIENLGNWEMKYAVGAGFQFYNLRILNELTLNMIKIHLPKGPWHFN